MADTHARTWGYIDILHNNVGVGLSGGDAELLDITEEAFEHCVAINLKSCIFGARNVMPIMRQQKSGAIINISSMAVITTYCLCRLQGHRRRRWCQLHRNARLQNAQYGIRANVIPSTA